MCSDSFLCGLSDQSIIWSNILVRIIRCSGRVYMAVYKKLQKATFHIKSECRALDAQLDGKRGGGDQRWHGPIQRWGNMIDFIKE